MSVVPGLIATMPAGQLFTAEVTSSSATIVSATTFAPTTFDSKTVLRMETQCGVPGCYDFRLELDSMALGQSFFRELLVQTSSGAYRIFRTSDATYADVGTGTPRSRWTWGDFSNPVWVTASAPIGADFLVILRKT